MSFSNFPLFFFLLFVSVSAQSTYCPTASDLVLTWGTPTIGNQGWTIVGGGGVATKAAFNLLGGFVEFDLDVTGVYVNVNANIYTISPAGISTGGYNASLYCDGQKTGASWCPEEDWLESNGNCGGQTTLHTTPGVGSNNCTAWGCANSYLYNGQTAFHMRIDHGADGTWTTTRNGIVINSGNLSPVPHSYDWTTIAQYFRTTGAVITSTQWQGWVPLTSCAANGGSLAASTFKLSNLVIQGTVMQGPTPTVCSSFTTTSVPTSVPGTHSSAVLGVPNGLLVALLSVFLYLTACQM